MKSTAHVARAADGATGTCKCKAEGSPKPRPDIRPFAASRQRNQAVNGLPPP